MLKEQNQSWTSFVIEMAVLLVIVLCIRFYVFQIFHVSGPSMCPTLNWLNEECEHGKGEFIFVNQFLYNFLEDPMRGEVVVFRPPNKRTHYVKRVIGVPGDTVTIQKGTVFLNNDQYEEYPLKEPYLSSRNKGRTYTDKKVFVVPEGEYLLFGDNRAESLDARKCFDAQGGCADETNTAFVTKKNIKGRAEFVIWPFWTSRWLNNQPEI